MIKKLGLISLVVAMCLGGIIANAGGVFHGNVAYIYHPTRTYQQWDNTCSSATVAYAIEHYYSNSVTSTMVQSKETEIVNHFGWSSPYAKTVSQHATYLSNYENINVSGLSKTQINNMSTSDLMDMIGDSVMNGWAVPFMTGLQGWIPSRGTSYGSTNTGGHWYNIIQVDYNRGMVRYHDGNPYGPDSLTRIYETSFSNFHNALLRSRNDYQPIMLLN